MSNRLSTAIVTGAGGDIGRAIALALCDRHAVAAVDLDGNAAEATAAAIRAAGGTAAAIACDVTDLAALARMADEARALGPVTVLVNNAGGASALSLRGLDDAALDADLSLNLAAAIRAFRALEPDLRRGGALVNIASVNGIGAYGHPAYSAAKAGLIHFTRLVAVEYGRFGLRANAVAPGTVRTRAWDARAAANPGVLDEAARWYPLGRVATPDDVAAAVRFLAGPDSAAITGICLPVDCGLTAGSPPLAATFTQSPDYGPKPE
jgi:NAD(P)-dependent dehydrogenase (short-subunit alcohol dehydrogenase family)